VRKKREVREKGVEGSMMKGTEMRGLLFCLLLTLEGRESSKASCESSSPCYVSKRCDLVGRGGKEREAG
jgi:hypothetical protein